MSRKIAVMGLAGCLAVATTVSPPAWADPFEGMLGGALGGAVIGGVVGGGEGAAAGAAIGALAGTAHGASQEAKQKRRAEEQRARYERERLQLERRRAEEERQYREQQRAREERQYREQQARKQRSQSARSGAGTAAQANLIIELQRSLTVLGYQPGPIDGRPGGSTLNAIKAYQQDQGLLVTGQPSEALLAHMRQRGG